ncbi:MAG: sensor domain-containing diguanylate cyclase [Candidatus Hydrogenedentes bacterium]|nr:sensor domain-containing diguanylate cyclase [Candidatus Hydrogenedentota bacterium]
MNEKRDSFIDPLYNRIRLELGRERNYPIIQISKLSVFNELCKESLKQFICAGEGNITVIGDVETLGRMEGLGALSENLKYLVVLSDSPPEHNIDVIIQPPPDFMDENDRIFMVISDTAGVVFLGTVLEDSQRRGEENFIGGWSYHIGYIRELLKLYSPSIDISLSDDATNLEKITELSSRIMSLHAELVSEETSLRGLDKNELAVALEILKSISGKRRAHDVLYVFVEKISKVVPSDRCSIVRIWGQDEVAHVLASHDDAEIYDMSISLNKYPEIKKALATGEKVIINDVREDPLMIPCIDVLVKAGIRSILVLPIVLYDQEVGSLLLRAVRKQGSFTPKEISFFEIVTNAAANALERAQLFESVQQANKALEKLAVTDGLTELYNHRYFRERFEEEILRAQRYKIPLSCALFDIDDFKKCNDVYGHLFGDFVLKEIAKRMIQHVRRTDIVARYGGEEFVIIMPQTDLQGAITQAERVRKSIEERDFSYMGREVRITVSGGVAGMVHDEVLNIEDMIRIADIGLYEAKRSGKNKIVAPQLKQKNEKEFHQ